MKAMALTGIRKMSMIEIPTPSPKTPDDVLIKMETVGVCGSDVHYYADGKIGSQVIEYPFVVGHECAGMIVDVGANVKTVAPGDRVAIDPAIYCEECDQCRIGRHHTCRKLLFLGCPGQIEGCLSEFVVMPAKCCIKIPDSMTFDQATISEPLAIGVYAVKRSIPMKNAKIAILGSGPIGLSVMLPAKARGAERVYMTDKLDSRLKLAKEMGADWIGNPDQTDIVDDIVKLEPGLLDVVFDCCGQQEALDQAVELLKPGGKLMLIGIPRADRVSFVIDQMRRKEICVQNVRRQVDCAEAAINMMADDTLNVDAMVTHHFPFDKTAEAFELVDAYRDGVVKAMITF